MATEIKTDTELDLVAEQDATELDEKISGNEPDDEFSGNELDDEFSGDELDDEFSGDELDDEFSGDELDDDFNGTELDEDALDMTDSDETEDGEENPAPGTKKSVFKKIVLPALAAGLVVVGVGGWFFFKSYVAWQPEKPKVARFKVDYRKVAALNPQKKEVSFDQIKPTIVTFKPFIVPVNPDGNITYISMDIALSLSTRDLTKEIKSKRVTLRGIIYGFLQKQVKNDLKRPTTDSMENSIARAVNRHLERGSVREVSVESWQPM